MMILRNMVLSLQNSSKVLNENVRLNERDYSENLSFRT